MAAEGAVHVKNVGWRAHLVFVGPGAVLQAINRLQRHKDVVYVEPDFVHNLNGGVPPNDTNAGNQWAIANESSAAAWSVTTGTNSVSVAILDTGVQYSHPDLLTNIWTNPGGIGGCAAGTHGYNVLDGSCDPMDDDASYGGHGTHVAGILGAVGNNRLGVAGVNWTTSIIPVKWVNASNTGYTSDLIAAMDWVIRAKQSGVNIRVVNDSATWAGTASSQALSDEIDLLGANDILFVSAAGNTAQNNDTIPRYPCSYNRPNMICAGASDQNDQLWSSSNYGFTTVQLAAPGVNIYSTLRQSNFGYISGGSMAAPQVSGTAALILSTGYLSVPNLRAAILNNVDSLSSLQGLVATGGRLNVCNAVPGCSSGSTAVPTNTQSPAIAGLLQSGSLLAASTGIWSGLPTAYSYQWYRCMTPICTAIPGATLPTYAALGAADVGATFQVAVAGANAAGSTTAPSATTAALTSAASPFSISSTIPDGTNVTGTMTWQVTPATAVNFVQFYIDGSLSQTISTSPYMYNSATTGRLDATTLAKGTHVLGVRALATDNRTYGFYGATVTVTGQNSPQNTSLPVISGSASQGQTLSTSNGSWSGNPSQFSYQWDRCNTSGANCSAISAATAASYTVAAVDLGFTLRSAVTATNSSGSNTSLSAPTATVSGSSGPNNSGILLVQSNAAAGTAAAFLGVRFPLSNTSGNLIIAAIRMSSTSQSATVTDSAGNVYTDAVSQTQSTDGHQIHLFYAKNINGGPNTVTATFSSTNNHPWIAIYEYSGVSATSPLDQTAHAQGGSGSTDTGMTAPTATANELVFAAAGLPSSYIGTVTPGNSFALQQQNVTTSRAATETLFSSATASFDGIFNINPGTSWSAVLATFRSGNSATAPPPPPPSGGGNNGIILVQARASEGTGVGRLSVPFTSSNTTGNLIVAFVRMSTSAQGLNVSDAEGNAYTDAVSQVQSNDGHQIHLFYAKNIRGGPNTVSVTFSSTNNHPWLAIYEYSGLSPTSPLDQTAHAQGNGAVGDSGPSAPTSAANELVFSAVGLPAFYTGSVAAGPGYILRLQDTGTSPAATATESVTSTGTFDGIFNLNFPTNWSAVVATFKR
jgi:hypothetical protein